MRSLAYRLEVHSGCGGVVICAANERDLCIAGEQIVRYLFRAELEAACVVESHDAESERRVGAYLNDVLADLRELPRQVTG
jgi:hypothetical protein